MTTIDVFENETFALGGAQDVVGLRRLLGGCLELRELGWAVTRFVGHVQLASGDVLRIRSRKSPSAAIIAWMAYADPTLRGIRVLDVLPDSADEGDAGALLARIFLLELLRAITRHGLVRRYRRERREVALVRGTIDFPKLAARGGDLSHVPCITWERGPETALNRLLAGAVHAISADSVLADACRELLPRARAALSGVAPLTAPIVPPLLARNEQAFDIAARLAVAVLRHCHLGDAGPNLGASFLVNIEALFERTLSVAFRDAGVPFEAKAPVSYEVRERARASTGKMAMDLLCKTTPRIVVDAKYKDRVNAANLQQLVTYCYVSGAPRGVAVVPCGSGSTGSSFVFRAGERADQNAITIDVVEIDTTARSAAEWRANGLRVVQAIMGRPS